MSNGADNSPLSYVNMSSSVLRSKFEKNRITNLQKQVSMNNKMEDVIDFETLKKDFDTCKNALQEMRNLTISEIKRVEEKLNSSLNNTCFKSEIENQIASIQLSLNEFYNKSEVDDKLNIISKQLESIAINLNENRSKTDDLREISEMHNVSNTKDFEMLINPVEEKIEKLHSSISDIRSTQNEFLLKRETEEKIETLQQSVIFIQSKIKDNISNDQLVSFENSMQQNIERLSKKIDNGLFETDDIVISIINNILPKDFKHDVYSLLNPDLNTYNEIYLKKHYLIYGIKEGRKYRFIDERLPEDFHWIEYVKTNIDLLKYVKTEDHAIEHYLTEGINEKRFYKTSQLEDVTFFIYSGKNSGASLLNTSLLNLPGILSIKIDDPYDFRYKYGQSRFDSLADLIKNNMKSGKTLYVIDIYRTPIEKKMCNFFDNLNELMPNYKSCDVSMLTSYFNKKHIVGNIENDDYDYLTEIMEQFDLPPITEFDFDKNYSIVKYENVCFIKIRFSEIKKWGDILSSITGLKVQIIENKRLDENKISELCEVFKQTYKFPREFLEKIKKYSSFNVYNSTSEKIKYIKDWLTNSI